MKLKNIYAILGCISLQLSAYADTTLYLAALSQIESGGKDRKIGSKGERSQYQLMPEVWHDHAKGPFEKCKGKAATIVARKYVDELTSLITLSTDRKPSAAQFYCAWNMGFNGFRKRGFLVSSCPKRVQERAERFANLVAALREEQK